MFSLIYIGVVLINALLTKFLIAPDWFVVFADVGSFVVLVLALRKVGFSVRTEAEMQAEAEADAVAKDAILRGIEAFGRRFGGMLRKLKR